MKRLITSLISVSMAAAAMPLLAAPPNENYEWARVVRAKPVIESVRYPVEEEVCWDEAVWRRDPPNRSVVPVIFGSIIGGVIGNQFGGGSGQDLMTFAGASLGGAIAHDAQVRRNPDAYYTVTEKRCSVETEWYTEETVVAWDVTYKYRGEVYHTRMRNEPGDRIRVRVQVDPLDY